MTGIEDSRLEGQELPSSRRSEDLFGEGRGGEGRGDFGEVEFGDGEFLAGGALSLAREARIASCCRSFDKRRKGCTSCAAR